MARVPRMSTSSGGEGIQRKSYNVGRMLGNRGSSQPGGGVGQSMVPRSIPMPPGNSGGVASGLRDYGKSAGGSSGSGGANIGGGLYTPNVDSPSNLKSLDQMGMPGRVARPPRPPAPAKGVTV